jgi:hypothetical protein
VAQTAKTMNLLLRDGSRDQVCYSWDLENRVTQVALPGALLNTMTYYGDGKRRRYQDSAAARVFLWDGQNIVRQTDDSGATNRNYTLKPAGFGELISQDGSFHHGVYPERSRGDALGGYVPSEDRHGGLRSRPSHSTDRLTDASQLEQVHYLCTATAHCTRTPLEITPPPICPLLPPLPVRGRAAGGQPRPGAALGPPESATGAQASHPRGGSAPAPPPSPDTSTGRRDRAALMPLYHTGLWVADLPRTTMRRSWRSAPTAEPMGDAYQPDPPKDRGQGRSRPLEARQNLPRERLSDRDP